MTISWWMIVLVVFVYINVGYLFAHWSWKVYHGGPGFLRNVFWFWVEDKDFDKKSPWSSTEGPYVATMSFLWVFKFLGAFFTYVLVIIVLFACLITSLVIVVVKTFTYPVRKIGGLNGLTKLKITRPFSAVFGK